jgi:hypothetical protein
MERIMRLPRPAPPRPSGPQAAAEEIGRKTAPGAAKPPSSKAWLWVLLVAAVGVGTGVAVALLSR